MALCILASHWKCTELGENAMTGAYVNGLEGFILDHGLRSESSKEATHVQNWVSKIGKIFKPNVLKLKAFVNESTMALISLGRYVYLII